MIKLIVSDLDGTLLDHSKKVSERERKALQQLSEQGINLCLASGRMHIEMTHVMDEIGITAHSVSQNGAFIYHQDGRLLQSQLFAPALAAELFEIATPYELVKLICSGEGNYITHLNEASLEIQSRMFQKFIVHEHAAEALTQDLPACKFSFFGDMEMLLEAQKELDTRLSGQLTMFVSDKDCLDIMPLNVSKGSALLVLLDRIGLRTDEIACIGDSFNDVSMFGITPHSFAMQAAHPEVKQAAAHEVQSVAEAISYVLAFNRDQTQKQREIRS